MTGRRMGYCSGYDGPGFFGGRGGRFRGRGMGFSRGFGRGRGMGPGYFFPEDQEPVRKMSKDEEKEYLTRTMDNLEKDLVSLKSRLKELEK
jgi:hypothetical protein